MNAGELLLRVNEFEEGQQRLQAGLDTLSRLAEQATNEDVLGIAAPKNCWAGWRVIMDATPRRPIGFEWPLHG